MKERYTIEKDGFVGYWHPAKGHDGKALIVFPGSGANYELTRKPRMEKILREAGYPYRYKATVYEKGSHLLCGDLSGSPEYLKSMKKILQAEYVDQDACNKARHDSMKEALAFLEGWK